MIKVYDISITWTGMGQITIKKMLY